MNNSKPIYILGTGLSHDGSACLLKNGVIQVAIEKERITRIKHDGLNDFAAIQYCLDGAGIAINDLDLIVQNANFGMFKRGNSWFRGPRFLPSEVPTVTISHHLAHAYGAIGTSPFEEAAILVIDGCGNSLDECIDLDGAIVPEDPPEELRPLYFEKDSYYIFDSKGMRPIYKDFSPWGTGIREYPLHPNTTMHSIGGLYLAASMYAFNGFEDAGKLMGLAPYGMLGRHSFDIFDLTSDRVKVRYDWMEKFSDPARSPEQFKARFQHYADLACWVQKELERAILYVVNSRYRLASSAKLCYAGGVALNAVANRRIMTESPFRDVYIQPAAGDNGLAVGCAYYGWLEVLKRNRVIHDGSTYFGRGYGESVTRNTLRKYKRLVSVVEADDCVRETAQLLADGNVVAWFQDRSEFGPRALGNRSILADPRRKDVGTLINSTIKFREDFRPFAPSVLAEDVALYFDCAYDSPHMLVVAPVRKQWQATFPSVVHRDGSARIHTVTAQSNPKYYNLLRAFKEITGFGVLLNTSLNRRTMPIVETPDQALDFYLNCGLDLLVIGDYVIRKLPEQSLKPARIGLLLRQVKSTLARHAVNVPMHGIYRIDIRGIQSWTIDLSGAPVVYTLPTRGVPDAIVEVDEPDFRALLAAKTDDEMNERLRTNNIRINGNFNKVSNLLGILRLK